MSINVTLFAQMIVFLLLVWISMKFIWPLILEAMDEREQKIANGLAAAEQGQQDLAQAKDKVEDLIREAREKAVQIVDQANQRAGDIVDEAKQDGRQERERQLQSAQAEIQQEINRARDELRGQVAGLSVATAEKILAREIDPAAHRDLLDQLAAEIY